LNVTGPIVFENWQETLSVLGQGSFGQVFQWRVPVVSDIYRRTQARYFAFKYIQNYGVKTASLTRVCNTEWIIQTLPFHPNIVQCYSQFTFTPPLDFLEAFTDPKLLDLVTQTSTVTKKRVSRNSKFVLLEYFPRELESFLEKEVLSCDQLMQICQDAANAIAFLYSKYIVHRDVKRNNFLVSDSGVVAICDFGLAIQFSDNAFTTKISIHDIKSGRADRLPPEIANLQPSKSWFGSNTDSLVKVSYKYAPSWELGLLFYEIALGVSPDLTQPVKVRAAAADFELSYPEPFLDLIQECLSRNPSKRPLPPEICSRLKELVPARTTEVMLGSPPNPAETPDI
jgi:serine/threonine protein kinase